MSRTSLEMLRGHVLEIGSSRMHASYAKGVSVDVYEPSKRLAHELETHGEATITTVDHIPDRKYDAIVVSYVYELLGSTKAQELSAIIGTRLKIDGLCITIEHRRPSLKARFFKRWTGKSIADTEHGLKHVDTYEAKGMRVRVYRRSVR